MCPEDANQSAATVPAPRVRTYSTATAAAILQVVPHTLRVAHSMRGGFYGVIPIKAPNGRLLWPADPVDAMATGSARAE
jgi:hypothetical protein